MSSIIGSRKRKSSWRHWFSRIWKNKVRFKIFNKWSAKISTRSKN